MDLKIYIAGPMTGVKDHNFPLFNEVAKSLRDQGHEVVNPAELDAGEEILTHPWDYYLRRDLKKLVDCEAIGLLPFWEKSRGARLEKYVAEALGMDLRKLTYLPIQEKWYPEIMLTLPKDALGEPKRPAIFDEGPTSILEEAESLVLGDRGAAYGHPADDMARTGKIWAAVLGLEEVTAAQVALCMVGVKISREVNKPKRDNRVDGAGYFQCLDMIREKEGV